MDLKYLFDVIGSVTYVLIVVVVALVAVLTYLRRGRLKLGQFSLEFGQDVAAEVEMLRRRIAEEVPEAEPAERQYVLLKEYHTQGLAQSKVSFWFSLVFASIGFAVVIVAILTIERDVQLVEQAQAFVSLVAGTVIELVSALFFVQSNRARQLMTEFFDRLRIDRKLDESLNLAQNIADETLRSRLQALMALNFAQVDSSDGILKMMLDLEDKDLGKMQLAAQPVEDNKSGKDE